jgi:hypothetical protein
MPTGATDLRRLRALFRYDVFRRHYGRGPGPDEYLDAAAPRVTADPNYLEHKLAALAAELGSSSRGVYSSRDKLVEPPDEPGDA